MARKAKFVAYCRVSTARQGASGLGLEAQQRAIEEHVASVGGEVVGELFVEVESGRRSDRPELQRALQYAKALGATLIVAKLDRLSRNVAFTSALLEAGVPFVAADYPQANDLLIHILSSVSQYEREAIGLRTKAALAAAKKRADERGERFAIGAAADTEGARRAREALRQNSRPDLGRAAIAAKADKAASDLAMLIDGLMREGATTLTAIAEGLEELGAPTRRGGRWTAKQVSRVLDRLGMTLPRAA